MPALATAARPPITLPELGKTAIGPPDPRCNTAAMTDRALQGWSADPFGLHEERYFSAGRPTKLVRDGKVETYDDPPSDSDSIFEAADGPAEPFGLGFGSATSPARSAGRTPRAPDTGGGYPRDPDVGLVVSKKSLARLLVAATMIVTGTILGLVVLVNQSRPATPPTQSTTAPAQGQAPAASPLAFVRQSAERTLAERTAGITLSGTVQAAGRTLPVNGTGEIDFSTNAMTLNLTVSSGGQPVVEKEILVDGNLFFSLNISGTPLARLTGGRDWIQMPLAQSQTANQVGSDPLSSLSVLEQQGINVQTLGTRNIEGVSCTGYAVMPTKQALLAGVRAESAKLGLSPAATQQQLSLAQGMLPPTVTVWLDAQGMVREMGVKVGLQVNGSGSAASGNVVLDFTNYGAPVQITPPASSDTISYPAFLQALGLKT